MTRTCTICRNESRTQIGRELIDGVPLRNIAKQSGASAAAFQRHKRDHLPKPLSQGKQAREVADGDALIAQMWNLNRRTLAIQNEAFSKASDRSRSGASIPLLAEFNFLRNRHPICLSPAQNTAPGTIHPFSHRPCADRNEYRGLRCGTLLSHNYHVIVDSVLMAVIQVEAAEPRPLHEFQHFLRRK